MKQNTEQNWVKEICYASDLRLMRRKAITEMKSQSPSRDIGWCMALDGAREVSGRVGIPHGGELASRDPILLGW